MIDFELSEEQQMIRDTVGAFALEQMRPAAREADETGSVPAELIENLWELGVVVQSAIPEKFGGAGDVRSAVTSAVIAEELGYGDIAIASHATAPRLFAFPILEAGTEEQRERHLKKFAAPKFVPATAALMEPRFDFDTTTLATSVRREGAGLVLNGRKCFVPLAADSESLLVYASSDPNAGYQGVEGFIIARNAPGLTISAREKNMGFKALATYGLEFKDCKIAPEARLGGEGGINFSRLMSETRVALAAMAVGMARAAYEYARDYAKERRAFGAAIAQKQAIAFILAEMAIEVDASRLLVWEAAWELDRGEDALASSYLAKNYVANSVLKITDNAVQVLGGHGYIREHPVEMWLRNARGLAALDGIATV
jgi:alkylation response protein AidB-like acyl-CoA dehydrogenase